MIAPLHSKLPTTSTAISQDKIKQIGRYDIRLDNEREVEVQIMLSQDSLLPVVFLSVASAFDSLEDPYDATELSKDTLIFAKAVEGLFKIAIQSDRFRQDFWLSAADWEIVPAGLLLHRDFPVEFTLHNIFDRHLAKDAIGFGDEFVELSGKDTALSVAGRTFDVVTTVSRGFASGLREDPFHAKITAPHLRELAIRAVGVDNASFVEPVPEAKEALTLFLKNTRQGREAILELKASAQRRLPSDLREEVGDKTIIVSMGRRCAQKLHIALAKAAEEIAAKRSSVHFVFATTGGAPDSDAIQEQLWKLNSLYPESVTVFESRISFFDDLMDAADFNCMPSLWEPFGGALGNLTVPIARCVDGLASQICAFEPRDSHTKASNHKFHGDAAPNGFLFREDENWTNVDGKLYRDLLCGNPCQMFENAAFKSIVLSLTRALENAVELRQCREDFYADLVASALQSQLNWSWSSHYASKYALIQDAINRRQAA